MKRILLAAALLGAMTGTPALAEEPVEYVKVCDTYGSGFFYIPGTETCLRIGDDLTLSGIRFDINPKISFYSPFRREFLETDGGATNPALALDVPSTGFELGFNLGAKINYDKFVPLDGDLNLTVGYQSGSASVANRSFPTGVGAPNTGGGVIGAYDGAATSLTTGSFDFNRTSASLDKRLGIPLGEGFVDLGNQIPTMGWRTAVFVGGRAGMLSQRESFNGTTNTNSTVRYSTDILGGWFGAYTGLELDTITPLPRSEFAIISSMAVTAGFNNFGLRTTDTLTGTGALTPGGNPQSNTVTTNHLIPTLDVSASVGLAKQDWFQLNLVLGANTGTNPMIGISRPTSNNLNGQLAQDLIRAGTWYAAVDFMSPLR